MFRVGGIAFDGAAQPANVGVDGALKAVVIALEGGVEQLLPGESAPDIA